MAGPLDLKRIAELEELTGRRFGSILQSLEQSIGGAIEEVDGALAAGDLDRAASAAHRCRNDALVVGASQLQEALGTLEMAIRGNDPDRSRPAIAHVRQLWLGAQEELTRAAQRGGSG